MKLSHLSLLFLLLAISCKQKKPTLFESMTNTGIEFNNVVEDGKLENSFLFRNFYNGGGVAIGDIDNDGLSDVFLTSNMGENKLYRNLGNWKFSDITTAGGFRQDSMWSTGVIMADVNGDGWLDIYVCNSGHMPTGHRMNKLYINNHNLTFTESAAQYGLNISAYTTQVSFFDYDLDGDLDCFMINNSPIPVNQLNYSNRRNLPEQEWGVAPFLKGGGDHLFRNDGAKFTEVTYQSGIHGSLISFGLGVSVGDINGDNFPDVYVSNDSYERDYLYINQKDGTFKDEFEECFEHTSLSSMGTDLVDINNDGYPDIFSTDMLPSDEYRFKITGAFDNIDLYRSKLNAGFYRQFVQNCLQLNNKDNTFSEIANYSGVAATDWSWGALMFDADNDGFNDIYVCNGVNRDVIDLDFIDFFANEVTQKMVLTGKKENVDEVLKNIPRNPLLNNVFRNKGNLQFEETGPSWGFTEKSFSNGAAYGDLDNDGDLDLIVNNENALSFIYKNNSREQNAYNYISIQLKGKGMNSFAIGSKIKIYKGEQVFYRELVPSRGFQSSVDYKQVVGLGKLKDVDSVLVTWPDRTESSFIKPAVNQLHTWQQPENASIASPVQEIIITTFDSVASNMVKHQEDDYIDFYYERNLPEQLSKEGPHMAVGDVNGDGLEDVYMAGAKGQEGALYLQTANGFERKEEPGFKTFAGFEDVAVLFFDADKDKDLDLFVGAGGNNVSPNSRELQHRLYLNDGKGNFNISTKAFGQNDLNISVAIAYDYDSDGDEDLFVGSRSVPYSYGVTPRSYIYNNDGSGHFSDVTTKLSKELSHVGMVTSASWTNLLGDDTKELVVTGQWMPTRIFSYNKTSHIFDEVKSTNLDNLSGWWQTVLAVDVNGDGKQDLVVGNIGENFYLRPDKEHPVKLWLKDFDNSGTVDQFLTRTIDGKDMPVFLKREVTDQFPGLRKQNLKHSDFAKRTVQDLFNKEAISTSQMKEFNYMSSIIAINNGNGTFSISKLPARVQLSSLNAIFSSDINADGSPDLILGGNMSEFPPQFGRLDASFGDVLLNNGKGGFKWIEPKYSGMRLRGEVRDIKGIGSNQVKNKYIIVARNDNYPAVYQFKTSTGSVNK